MNRTILTVAGVFSASSLLLLDSAVKGTVLLVFAAVAALILRRDSAATRHLAWLLAIVAMLAVPVLSAMLPQWRVLPAWASPSPEPAVVDVNPPSIVRPADVAVELPQAAVPVEVERPSATGDQAVGALPDSHPAPVTPAPVPPMWSWNWINTLPLVWVIGFSVLILRLTAARWLLWNSERRAAVVGVSRRGVGFQPANNPETTSGRLEGYPTTNDPIVTAMAAICSQLGIGRPVTLLIHPEKTIPVVWGILRCRLLLPSAARQWSDEQLRSVLLHELAHIKRCDATAQLLTQIACVLHWFNPLVWFAAWRLDVERERACDDLVLASGVRPSAYAGHLLEVVTGLSPVRWTQTCGLAMARRSSLEGRLAAVLGKNLNRRGMSVALAGIALAIAVGIAVPIAMLRAAQQVEPEADAAAMNAEPQDAQSKVLFENWKTSVRTDGKIPGGRIGEMAASLKIFMDLNAGSEAAAKCEAVFKKCDATHDWTLAEAAALLDEIELVAPSRSEWAMRTNIERQIHPGKLLPDELKDAQLLFEAVEFTGKLPPDPHKLEVPDGWGTWAIVCRPSDGFFYLLSKGTVRKIDYSAPRKVTDTPANDLPAEFRDEVKRQLDIHEIPEAQQAEILEKPPAPTASLSADEQEIPQTAATELQPTVPEKELFTAWGKEVGGLQGGICIINANDIRIGGKVKAVAKLRNVSKDTISVTPVPLWMLRSVPKVVDSQDKPVRTTNGPYPLLDLILAKLTLKPGETVDVSNTEIPVAELNQEVKEPDKMANRLIIHVAPGKYKLTCTGLVVEHSELATGPGEFEVNAATVRLEVKGKDADGKTVVLMRFEELQRDEATSTVKITSAGGGGGSVGSPMFIVRGACEIAKARGAAYFANLKEWDGEDGTRMYLIGFSKNKDIRPLTNERQLQIFAVSAYAWLFKDPAGADANKPPAKPPGANMVKLPDDQYVKSGFPQDELVGEGVMWNDEQNGLSLGYRITGDEWRILGNEVKVELWVQNPGDKDVKFQLNMRPDIGLRVKLKDAKGEDHNSDIWPNDTPPLAEHRLLPPGHALKVKEFTVSLFLPENDFSYANGHFFGIAPGAYKFHCELDLPGFTATGEGGKQLTPAEGEWTGKLTTRELKIMVVAPDAPAPTPRIEHADVNLEKDGTLHFNRKKVTLDELKALAAKDAKKRFTIRADNDVPYAKVIEVVDALKAAGVTEFSFSEARVGDGKYRVANRTGTYEFDDKHGFSICRPSERPQWFTVSWPAEGDRPACWLRIYPNVSEQTQGKWAVVWEPGTDVLWWVDDSDVGKMTLTDPARVIVDREGRTNNFSRDFGLPEDVKAEFRRLGFVIGRDKTPGLETTIGGNTGGQSIVSADFGMWSVVGTVTDADGKPLANVPVPVSTNQELKTEKTDAKGEYRAYFSLPLQLLAHWRAVTVEPVLEGFTERDMAKSGEFNVLLRAGEEPQHVRLEGDKDFQPAPIPRFAERDLLPSQRGASPGKPGRADFVMLKAAEITGELVTADGKPAPPHWVAASTPEQRPGHNAAIQLSDDKGHFRLKGIPANKPVILTVNPDGKPGETSKSSEQEFEQAREHKLRIFLPAEGSGKGPVKIERRADPKGGAALKPDANAAVRVVDGAAQELRKSPPYNFRDSDQYRALDESSRSRLKTVVDDLAQLERALDSFMKDHDGTPPETLEQLLPKYIVRLPEDPFASPDEKIPDDLKHYQRSLDGRGYLYLHRPKPWTFQPPRGAWEIRSVGLRTFPLRYEKSNPGLIHTRGYWGRLQLDVF